MKVIIRQHPNGAVTVENRDKERGVVVFCREGMKVRLRPYPDAFFVSKKVVPILLESPQPE